MAPRVIALVACAGEKVPLRAGQKVAAKDLYLKSDLFSKSRALAEATTDGWAILSAKHGLLMPDDKIATYNVMLKDYNAAQRREWARAVAGQLLQAFGPKVHYVVLAGRDYRAVLGYLPNSFTVPMEGLGIGQQKAWLKAELARLGVEA